jgi:hypothetical protein
MRMARQETRRAEAATATGRAGSPIDFGGKLSTATHTLATVVECSERAYGCTVEERRGVDEVVRPVRVADEALQR